MGSLTLRFLNTPILPSSISRRQGYAAGGYPHDGSLFFGPSTINRNSTPSDPPLAPSHGTASKVAHKERLAGDWHHDERECYDDLPANGSEAMGGFQASDSDEPIEDAPVLRGPSNGSIVRSSSRPSNDESHRAMTDDEIESVDLCEDDR